MAEQTSPSFLQYRGPIDRAARDRLADTLAAYMRAEVDNFVLHDVAIGQATADPTVRQLGFTLWFFYDDLKRHPVAASPEQWELFRRIVAFLKTERMLAEVHRPREEVPYAPWTGLAALVTVAAALPLGWFASRWWLLLPGATVGLWETARGYTHPDPAMAPRTDADRWYPFETEEDWHLAEPFLESVAIPPYEAAVNSRPIRTPSALWWVSTIPAVVFLMLVVAPLVSIVQLSIEGRRRGLR